MLATLGLMVASYCIARLMLAPLTMPTPTPPSPSVRAAVCMIVLLGVLGVGYCAWTLLGQGVDNARPAAEKR